MIRFLFAPLLLLASCVGVIRPDPSIPSIQAGYPSAAFYFDGRAYAGLGVIPVLEEQDLSGLNITVQTVESGTIRIDSDACAVSLAKRYENSELVRIPLAGPARSDCLISVTVVPEYPQQESSPIPVFGFRGHFAIRVIRPGESWIGGTHKVTGAYSKELVYHVGGPSPVRVIFSGCGATVDRSVNLDASGDVRIRLSDLVNVPIGSVCVLEGAIISPSIQDLLINEVVSKYDPEFAPLPLPTIETVGSRVRVRAGDSVSLIGVNGAFRYTNSLSIRRFDATKRYTIHAVTTRGRSVVCAFDKDWICQQ